jgi:hypothetical protein
MFNLFGKKKVEASTVSATPTQRVSDPQTTIVRIRESIQNQDKRCVMEGGHGSCRSSLLLYGNTNT